MNSSLKSPEREEAIDWRPQAIRVFAIFIVVVGHMLTYTGYIVNDARNPIVWLGGIAIGVFMACAGYVHGLKDEFNKPGSLNGKTYMGFVKKRFFRLYIGYYLAIGVVVVAKLWAGYTIAFSATAPLEFGLQRDIIITPASIALDLSCMWPLLTMNLGGLWPEGWFICAMMILSLSYPILRRIYSINKNYLYIIMIALFSFRLFVIIHPALNANYAYYFPFAWTAEFSLGIIIGDRICKKGGPSPPSAKWQRIINKAAERVWPLYLFHMSAVVFMPDYAPLKDFLLTILVFLILTEIFHQILSRVNKFIGGKVKKSLYVAKAIPDPTL